MCIVSTLPFLYCLQPPWPCVLVYMCVYSCGERGKFHFHFCYSTCGSIMPHCPLAASMGTSCNLVSLSFYFSFLCLSFCRFSCFLDLDGLNVRPIVKTSPPAITWSFSLIKTVFISRPLPQDMSRWTRRESLFCPQVLNAAFLFFTGRETFSAEKYPSQLLLCLHQCLRLLTTWKLCNFQMKIRNKSKEISLINIQCSGFLSH